MKTKYIYSLIAFSMIMFIGCTDLDTYPESDIVTSEQKTQILESDPSKFEAGVNAIFSQFSTYMSITGDNHSDIGYPSVMLFTDSNGADFLGQDNGYNFMSNSMEFSDRDYTADQSKIVWGTMYKMIYVANNVIGTIDPETKNETTLFYLGQALAARAFDYWVLAQLYQFTYVDNKTAPCVPLITEKNSVKAVTEGCPRSTVEQVYGQINTDLKNAIILLEAANKDGIKRKDKRYIDLGVAYGLRARVNLTMQNWAEAAADAQKAIEISGAVPYSSAAVTVPTMYDSNDNSWMWGIVVTENDRVVTSGIVNWPSHMGSLNYGYANYSKGHQINKKLYNSIPATDVRKGWWLDANKKSVNLVNMDAQQKTGGAFQEFALRYLPYTQVKFAPYKNELKTSVNANDIPLMRVEEMYLIKAEGETMSGNLPGGKKTLEDFVKTYRDVAYTCIAANATDMQEEIHRQRRIELWGEGLSWFDVMRLKKGVDRRGGGYPDVSMIFNIPAGDKIMLWRLPELEIQANKALKATDNNPTAPAPTPVPDMK